MKFSTWILATALILSPSVANTEERLTFVGVTVTQEEKEVIREAAHNEGLSMSDYARTKLGLPKRKKDRKAPRAPKAPTAPSWGSKD